ncbi:MAG: hypothetical protein M3O36_07470 [Myxococcota bacterium]|nr:hypothetical protein [Myxococcota bacterium]
MSSELDICKTALSLIGDPANISSISPPDSSVQAQQCATFYPIARDSLLSFDWNFNTRRDTMPTAALPANVTEWLQAYTLPAGCLKLLAILDPNAGDDISAPVLTPLSTPSTSPPWYSVDPMLVNYQPQPFVVETAVDGTPIVYTNQQNAFGRFTIRVTDTSKFSPLFVETCAWQLAGYLAGPIIKGEEGIKAAQACFAKAKEMRGEAKAADAASSKKIIQSNPSWIAGR